MVVVVNQCFREGPEFISIVRGVARWVRWRYFTCVGWVAKQFSPPGSGFRVGDVDDWGHVAVLGRGASAALILSEKKNYDLVLLCNYENADLQDSEFLDYLSSQRLVLLSNIEESTLSPGTFNLLTVVAIVWAGWTDGRGKRKRVVGRLNSYGREVEGLPPDFDFGLFQLVRNTGILGVALAAFRSSKVDVFGLEFYTTDYISGTFDHIAGSEARELARASAELKAAFAKIIKFFKSTNFTHWCFTDHKLVSANLTPYVIPRHASRKG